MLLLKEISWIYSDFVLIHKIELNCDYACVLVRLLGCKLRKLILSNPSRKSVGRLLGCTAKLEKNLGSSKIMLRPVETGSRGHT